MHKLAYAYGLTFVCLCLCGIAVTAFVRARSLSLPISDVLTILPIVLPILFPAVSLLIHRLKSQTRSLLARPIPNLHFVLLTVLATLLGRHAFPGADFPCSLSTHWQGLYSRHDATSIRRIQDSLNCCGYRSVRDMAWPFPTTGPSTCAATYGRDLPCAAPWMGSMRGIAGADLGVVLVLGILQALVTMAANRGESGGWFESWGNAPQVGNRRGGWRLISHPDVAENATAVEEEDEGDGGGEVQGLENGGNHNEESRGRGYGTMTTGDAPPDRDSIHANNAWRE